MGAHCGEEGGLVFKDPSLPAHHSRVVPPPPPPVPVGPALFNSQQAPPTPSLYAAAGEGVGVAVSKAASPRLPILPCPQLPCLVRLIVPFSTPSPHWLMGFQTPFAA